jgi:hypothetical protein
MSPQGISIYVCGVFSLLYITTFLHTHTIFFFNFSSSSEEERKKILENEALFAPLLSSFFHALEPNE